MSGLSNAFVVTGTDVVGQVYFVKANWPKCIDCDGWSIGLAVEQIHGEDVEIPVCAVDGFHRHARAVRTALPIRSGGPRQRLDLADLQDRRCACLGDDGR